MKNPAGDSEKEKLRISLVTPTYRSGKLLDSCIQSIKEQKYSNLEYIIVDGGGCDETKRVVSQHGDVVSKFISEPDEGMYDAINKGFAHATGDIFCWLNTDDKYFPNCLDVVSEIFASFPDVMWISGYQAVSVSGVVTSVCDAFYPKDLIQMGLCNGKILPHITQEAVFWRRQCWEECGPIPSHLRLAGDFWLWRMFSEKWELTVVDALLASFSRREGQLSVLCETEYGEEVKGIVGTKVTGRLQKRLNRMGRMSRFWPLLRCLPKVKSVLFRYMGEGAISVPYVYFQPDKGWQKNRVYIWQRRSMLDSLFRRFSRERVSDGKVS